MPSEGALLAYLHFHPEHAALAVAVATVANTAGGMTSYLVGRLIPQKTLNPRALAWVRRYGAAATFLAFLPLIGDALCLAAGWLRVHWTGTLAFSAAGRFARYVVIALLS
jgi:membrane protein YqaA with SNARE-associated domain